MIKKLLHNRDNIILLEKFKESRGMYANIILFRITKERKFDLKEEKGNYRF